jgi:hypothetical protein
LEVQQLSGALAFTTGGKNSLAYNDVSQSMGIDINVF